MNLPRPLRGLVEAWYARSFYAEVGRLARGAGLVYLLVTVALWQLITITGIAVGYRNWVEHDAPRSLAQVPLMIIDHGRLTTDVALPYRMGDAKTGQVWAVIDTGATIDDLPPGPSVLITSRQVYVRRSTLETRVFQLASVRHLEIDRSTILRWLRVSSYIMPPCLYVFLVAFAWVWNLGVALFVALIGFAVARARGPRLDYAACMRIAAVALTPVIALDAVLLTAHLKFGLWWMVSLAIAIAYTVWGVRATQAAAAEAMPGGPPAPEMPAPEPVPSPPASGPGPPPDVSGAGPA